MTVRVSWESVGEKVRQLARRVSEQCPRVDVEHTNWVELSGEERRRWQARGFPYPRIDVQGYLVIRGDREATEAAAALAEDKAAAIWEEDGIVIEVVRSDVVWCQKSGELEATPLGPRQPLVGPRLEILADASDRSIQFLCFVTDEHQHEWANVRPH